ncbi:MAG: hypothetical protein PHV34_12560 [Verrucomicrobiae bacterium]|nr:hypothetical protein [Verrucomicrobiae bacterium]
MKRTVVKKALTRWIFKGWWLSAFLVLFLWGALGTAGFAADGEKLAHEWEGANMPYFIEVSERTTSQTGDLVVDSTAWNNKALRTGGAFYTFPFSHSLSEREFFFAYPWSAYTVYFHVRVDLDKGRSSGPAFRMGAWGPGPKDEISRIVQTEEIKDENWHWYKLATFVPSEGKTLYLGNTHNLEQVKNVYLDMVCLISNRPLHTVWYAQQEESFPPIDPQWNRAPDSKGLSWKKTALPFSTASDGSTLGLSLLRKEVVIPAEWEGQKSAGLEITANKLKNISVYFNGEKLCFENNVAWIPGSRMNYGKRNLLALKVVRGKETTVIDSVKLIHAAADGKPAWLQNQSLVEKKCGSWKVVAKLPGAEVKAGDALPVRLAVIGPKGGCVPHLELDLYLGGEWSPVAYDEKKFEYSSYIVPRQNGDLPLRVKIGGANDDEPVFLATFKAQGTLENRLAGVFPLGLFHYGHFVPKSPVEREGYYEKICGILKKYDFDCLVPGATHPGMDETESYDFLFAPAAKNDIRILVWPWPAFKWGTPEEMHGYFQKVTAAFRPYAKQILAYGLWDEIPLYHAKQWRYARNLSESQDPLHPPVVCLNYSDRRAAETTGSQVYFRDIYCAKQATPPGEWLGDLEAWLKYDAAVAESLRIPYWVVLQGGWHKKWGGVFGTRMPTCEEIRASHWLSIACGAKGIFHFMLHYGGKEEDGQGLFTAYPELRPYPQAEVAKEMNVKIKKISRLLLDMKNAPGMVSTQNPKAMVTSRIDSRGKRYLFVVNKNVVADNAIDILLDKKMGGSSVRFVDALNGQKYQAEGLLLKVKLAAGDGKMLEISGD